MNGSQNTAARRRSPLDGAKGHEVVWQQVAPLFEAAAIYDGSHGFVYVIGEPDDGAVKIGHALDPVARLRTMQTGNPRHLRVEYVVIGRRSLERQLHELWRPFVVPSAGTEWFQPEARLQLLPIIRNAAKWQANSISDAPSPPPIERLERLVLSAHKRDYIAQGKDDGKHFTHFEKRNGKAVPD